MSISNENRSNPSYTQMSPILFPLRIIEWNGNESTTQLRWLGLDPLEMLQKLASTAEMRNSTDEGPIPLRFGSTKLSNHTLPLPTSNEALQASNLERISISAHSTPTYLYKTDILSPDMLSPRSCHHNETPQVQVTLSSRDKMCRPADILDVAQAPHFGDAPHVIVPDGSSSSTETDDENDCVMSFNRRTQFSSSSFAIQHTPLSNIFRTREKQDSINATPTTTTGGGGGGVQSCCDPMAVKSQVEKVNLLPRVRVMSSFAETSHPQMNDDDDDAWPPWMEVWMLSHDPMGSESIQLIFQKAHQHQQLEHADKMKESLCSIRDRLLYVLRRLHDHAFLNVQKKKDLLMDAYSIATEQLDALLEVTPKIGAMGMDHIPRMSHVMHSWLSENWINPFPDDDELQRLSSLCQLDDVKPINQWLVNARNRKWRPALKKAHDMNCPIGKLRSVSLQLYHDAVYTTESTLHSKYHNQRQLRRGDDGSRSNNNKGGDRRRRRTRHAKCKQKAALEKKDDRDVTTYSRCMHDNLQDSSLDEPLPKRIRGNLEQLKDRGEEKRVVITEKTTNNDQEQDRKMTFV